MSAAQFPQQIFYPAHQPQQQQRPYQVFQPHPASAGTPNPLHQRAATLQAGHPMQHQHQQQHASPMLGHHFAPSSSSLTPGSVTTSPRNAKSASPMPRAGTPGSTVTHFPPAPQWHYQLGQPLYMQQHHFHHQPQQQQQPLAGESGASEGEYDGSGHDDRPATAAVTTRIQTRSRSIASRAAASGGGLFQPPNPGPVNDGTNSDAEGEMDADVHSELRARTRRQCVSRKTSGTGSENTNDVDGDGESQGEGSANVSAGTTAAAAAGAAARNETYGIEDEETTGLWDLADGPEGYSGKPPYPYLTLIRIALLSSEHKRLTLQELYDALEQRYPFFNGDGKGWKNSIRHNLSLNKCFKKEARHVLDPGKGSYWFVDTAEEYSTPRIRQRRTKRKKGAKDDSSSEHDDAQQAEEYATNASTSGTPAVASKSRKRKADPFDPEQDNGFGEPHQPTKRAVRGKGSSRTVSNAPLKATRPPDLKLPAAYPAFTLGRNNDSSGHGPGLAVQSGGTHRNRMRAISAPSPITASFFTTFAQAGGHTQGYPEMQQEMQPAYFNPFAQPPPQGGYIYGTQPHVHQHLAGHAHPPTYTFPVAHHAHTHHQHQQFPLAIQHQNHSSIGQTQLQQHLSNAPIDFRPWGHPSDHGLSGDALAPGMEMTASAPAAMQMQQGMDHSDAQSLGRDGASLHEIHDLTAMADEMLQDGADSIFSLPPPRVKQESPEPQEEPISQASSQDPAPEAAAAAGAEPASQPMSAGASVPALMPDSAASLPDSVEGLVTPATSSGSVFDALRTENAVAVAEKGAVVDLPSTVSGEGESMARQGSPPPGPVARYSFPGPSPAKTASSSPGGQTTRVTIPPPSHAQSQAAVPVASASQVARDGFAIPSLPFQGQAQAPAAPGIQVVGGVVNRPAPLSFLNRDVLRTYSPPPSAGMAQSPTRLLPSKDYDTLFSNAPFGVVFDFGAGGTVVGSGMGSTTFQGSGAPSQRMSRSGSIFGLTLA